VLAIVVHGLVCLDHSPAGQELFAGIEVPVVTWEVAAGNLKPDAVSFAEQVGGSPEIDTDLIDLSRGQWFGSFTGIAVAKPEDAIGQVSGKAIGVDIHQFGCQISVNSG